MLDNRKKKVLQAIVEEYIETAEPVSSKALVDKQKIDFSSATIRNDMAELEKIGLLEKPHTSAGRVPSAKGYRYYVDELINYNSISRQEIKYIQNQLESKVNQIEDLTKITTSTLSEITHYTSVGIGPKAQDIEEIKFVLLGSRLLMAVILTGSGLIKETIIKFDEDITEEQVKTLTFLFNNKLKGKTLDYIDRPIEEYIFSEMTESLDVITTILEEIKKVINAEDDVYYEGANKVFELPEFKDFEMAKNFINVLDEKDTMIGKLNESIDDDIHIYIGDEEDNELKDFSIITFNNKVHGKSVGTIGIIGPKRMDYAKVIAALKYINRRMNQGGLLTSGDEKQN